MLVRLAKKFSDFVHSGCCQGPISAKKRFAWNKGLPELFFEIFLAPIMYQDLFSNISKIYDAVFCLRKIILKRSEIIDAKKISKKKIWADTRFEPKVFWHLLGPEDTQSDRSWNFFTKQTIWSSEPITTFQYLYFDKICLPEQLQKKVPKMPKFKNGTALSPVFPDSALKSSTLLDAIPWK